MSEENQYILYQDNPPDTTAKKSSFCFIKFLAILFTMTVSTICSVYIMMIYHDIHHLYVSVQDATVYLNNTNVQMLHSHLEFISYCISEKYCKRIH